MLISSSKKFLFFNPITVYLYKILGTISGYHFHVPKLSSVESDIFIVEFNVVRDDTANIKRILIIALNSYDINRYATGSAPETTETKLMLLFLS
jgi:uncharacterized protein YebE (UPF0316 family)